MSLALIHEAEQQRQQPRYRIPVTADIDGWLYPVREWSLAGFSVAGLHDIEQLAQVLAVKFLFRFDGFSAVFELQAEVVWRLEDEGQIGCRFHDMTDRQLASLRAIIDAYVSGDYLLMGDLIHVVKRENLVARKKEASRANDGSRLGKIRRMAKRVAGLTALCTTLVVLLGFGGWVVYKRVFVVEALSAMVSAPIVVIRAPQHSYFEPAVLPPDGQVRRGQPLAFVELIGGGALSIDSPCDCRVLESHVLPREFAAVGEPLMTLLPADRSPHISARFAIETIERVAIGDAATVRLPDGTRYGGRVEAVKHGDPPERRVAARLLTPPANVVSYGEITIIPDADLNPDLLGTLVSVSINTFRRRR